MASPTSNPAKKKNSYRCPACGGFVDSGRWDEVRLHHGHVLHPPQDCYVKLPSVPLPWAATAQRLLPL